MSDLIIRPADPIAKSGPDQQRILFAAMAQASRGHSMDEVIGAALNIVVNALRQTYPSREKALVAADQKAAQFKDILSKCYTSAGRLNGVFPFNQHIEMPHFIDKDSIRG